MKIKIVREISNNECTLGRLYIDGVEQCYTLEDVQRDVKIDKETAIPKGSYSLELQTVGVKHMEYIQKFANNPGFHKGMIQLKNVTGFSGIMIHIGNSKNDTEGCILVGKIINKVINQIQNSKDAYIEVYPIIRDGILSGSVQLTIE